MTPLDTLRQLQAEATPGPWEYPELILGHPNTSVLAESDKGVVVIGITHPADARLIAAAPTHLADLITALEREAKVRELHKPVTQLGGNIICPSCMDDSTVGYLPAPYPCPTIRILDGNE